MKKIIFFLIIFLNSNSAENNFLRWQEALKSHYIPGCKIRIINQTDRTITVLNGNYFKTDGGIKFFHIGISITPGMRSIIDLSKIVSIKKIKTLKFCTFKSIKNHLKDSDTPLYYPGSAISRIRLGKTYIVIASDWDGKLIVT